VYSYEDGHCWARLCKNTLFNGASIALIYSISRFCLKTISRGYLTLPQLPKKIYWSVLSIGLYNNLYILAGCLIHPAIFFSFGGGLEKSREDLFDGGRDVKRISIKANGYTVDALILGKRENLGNGRWIVFSGGNGECYERIDQLRLSFADSINANILLYNYPSIGRSSGFLPNRGAILASHRAMLSFLENKVGATEIIDFGHSIAGGIQGENLKTYSLRDEVKYVFIKNKTFSSISVLARRMFLGIGKVAVQFLKWDYSSVVSSKSLKHHEIIIQQGTEFIRGYWDSYRERGIRTREDTHVEWDCDYLRGRTIHISIEEDDENPFSIILEDDHSFSSRLDLEKIDKNLLARFMSDKKVSDPQVAKRRIYEEYIAYFIDNHVPKLSIDGHVGFSKVVQIRTWDVMPQPDDNLSIRKIELLEYERTALDKILNLSPKMFWRISFKNGKHVVLEKEDVTPEYVEMTNISQISMSDGVIQKDESLAKALFTDPNCNKENKTFCLVADRHNEPTYTFKSIADLVNRKLSQQIL